MRSSLIFLAVCVCIASAGYDCWPKCDPRVTVNLCADYSKCGNVLVNANTNETDYRCICGIDFEASCTSVNGSIAFSCIRKPAGCGTKFPNGCPTGSYCIATSATGDMTCACRETGFELTASGCLPRCYENSHFDDKTRVCVCNEGYYPDPLSVTYAPFVKCAMKQNATTCGNGFACPRGYVCKDTNAGPYCAPDSTTRKCGVDFFCPTDVASHYRCVDSTSGPQCVCQEGWGGLGCSRLACFLLEGKLGCWWGNDSHAQCRVEPSGTGFCVCETGYYGDKCEKKDDKCAVVKCAANNTRCVEGVCKCVDGYVPTFTGANYEVFTCVAVSTPSCDGVNAPRCTGNYRCAMTAAGPKCVCPFDEFSAYDCNKPRCYTDADCPGTGFCVSNTKDGIPPYCTCKPGYGGAYCNETKVCKCEGNRVCTNEGRCVCAPTFSGDDCAAKNATTVCVKNEVFIKVRANGQAFTAEEIETIITIFVKIDISNMVVEGPYDTKDASVKKYTISFCSDVNVDGTKSRTSFDQSVTAGNTGGLNIVSNPDSVTPASTTGMNASATVVVNTFLVLCAFLALLL